MRHIVIAGILVLVSAIAVYFGLTQIGLMPVAASAQAVPIDWMWNWQVIAMSFLFALIVVPLVYALVVFRRKKGDTADAEHIEGNTKLEITWTIIPLITVITFAYMGAWSLGQTRIADPQAMIVKVHARQFAWTFEYPEYGFFSTELRLPVWKQVLLQMDSADVIHSFWVPEFRVKQDVVPGRVTELRVTPNVEGAYKVRCAELCGASHAYMEGGVMVVSEEAFQQWVAEQQELAMAQTPEGRGKKLATENGCFGCHSVTAESLPNAPSWFGLFGSTVKLADGTSVVADEAYLRASIVEPMAAVVEGYTPIMPLTYGEILSDEEIADIIAFIISLK